MSLETSGNPERAARLARQHARGSPAAVISSIGTAVLGVRLRGRSGERHRRIRHPDRDHIGGQKGSCQAFLTTSSGSQPVTASTWSGVTMARPSSRWKKHLLRRGARKIRGDTTVRLSFKGPGDNNIYRFDCYKFQNAKLRKPISNAESGRVKNAGCARKKRFVKRHCELPRSPRIPDRSFPRRHRHQQRSRSRSYASALKSDVSISSETDDNAGQARPAATHHRR